MSSVVDHYRLARSKL